MNLDHVDIVVTHTCNMNCRHCIDKYRGCYDSIVSVERVENFLNIIDKHANKGLEVLLLGGEPTVAGEEHLIKIADIAHKHGFEITMSSNGQLKSVICGVLPFFDSVQITTHSDKETDFWEQYGEKINIKISGDRHLTKESLEHFVDYTKNKFFRRSVSMYFTEDFEELCTDRYVWDLLDKMQWNRNGSYKYAFYEGVRFKKCIHGETNIIDEPTIPKLYPSGVYNKTWCNEHSDPYLE